MMTRRRIGRIFTITFAAMLIGAACYAQAPAKVFNAKTYTLPNGLEVVVIENNRAPVVTHILWVKTGGADEPHQTSGIAHFLEHLMFKGTPTVGPGEYSKILRKIGAEENAFTAQDYTAYFATVSKNNLELVMKLESDRFQNLSLLEKDVDSERKVILEERSQRTDNDPGARLAEQMQTALFVNHPYGEPVIGWRSEMEKLSHDDAVTFYKNWYAPNNMLLVIAGAVSLEEIKPLVEKYYANLKPAPTPARARPAIPDLAGQTQITLTDTHVKQPIFHRLYRAPSVRQNPKESYALEVLEQILGDGATGLLYKKLAIETKIAGTIDFSYAGVTYDDSTMTIAATPAKDISLETLQAAIDKTLTDFAKAGPTDEDVENAKKRLIAQAAFARDSLSGPAFLIGYVRAIGVPLDDIEYWPSRIEAVTSKDVKDVVAKYIAPNRPSHPAVTGFLKPAPAGEAQ